MEGNPTPPPPAYAAYPRSNNLVMYGSSEKLFRLYRGYHGMSYTFLLGILCYILAFAIVGVIRNPSTEVLGYLLGTLPLASFLAMYYFSIRSVRDIAFGNNWSDTVGLLLGLFVPFMCLILCVVLSFVASSEMKRYGLTMRSFRGIDTNQVKETIARMAEAEKSPQPFSTAVPDASTP